LNPALFLTGISEANSESSGSLSVLFRSLFSLLAPLWWRTAGDPQISVEQPRPVTKGRRLLAMDSGALAFSLVSGGITVGLRALLLLPNDFQYFANVVAHLATASALLTRHDRGLPGLISGQDVKDNRHRNERSGSYATGAGIRDERC